MSPALRTALLGEHDLVCRETFSACMTLFCRCGRLSAAF